METFTVGLDTTWKETYTGNVRDRYAFFVPKNNEVYAKFDKIIYKFHDNATYKWQAVKDLGYTRYGYSHIATTISLDSGIEAWCLSNIKPKCSSNTTESKESKPGIIDKKKMDGNSSDSFWNIFK